MRRNCQFIGSLNQPTIGLFTGSFNPTIPSTGVDGPPATLADDDFESYLNEANLNTLNDGNNWAVGYRADGPPDPARDDFETYNDGDNLDLLDGGFDWSAAYRSAGVEPTFDDFESYTDGANLDTLNGGTNWSAAYRAA